MLITHSVISSALVIGTILGFLAAQPTIRTVDRSAGIQERRLAAIGKRQVVLSATRQAVVQYYCPLSGNQERTFIWRGVYDEEAEDLAFENILHIDSWDLPRTVTNDFAVNWQHKFCRLYEHHCCTYTFTGQVMGAIYHDHMQMELAQARWRNYYGVTVTEVCVQVHGDDMCPAKTLVLRGHYSNCEVTRVNNHHI